MAAKPKGTREAARKAASAMKGDGDAMRTKKPRRKKCTSPQREAMVREFLRQK